MTDLRRTRAGVAVLAAVLAVSHLSGCGACWPGPCVNEPGPTPTPSPTPNGSVTPTPTPTAVPSAVCDIVRQPELVDANLWAAVETNCPRLLLSPEEPKAADPGSEGIANSAICEAGRRTSGSQTTFFFRFTCGAARPWELSVATASETSADELTLSATCDEVTFTKTFTQGEALEEILWEESQADIEALWEEFGEACAGFDVGTDSYKDCARYCSGEDSLFEALNELAEHGTDLLSGVSLDVECYLTLFDAENIASFLETVSSEDDGMLVSTSCACAPTVDFLACLGGSTFPCFDGNGIYDESCGQECWEEDGATEPECE